MKTIRKSIWETNSSSSHSLVIRKEDFQSNFLNKDRTLYRQQEVEKIKETVKNHRGSLRVVLREYGWDFNLYDSFADKLSYLLSTLLPSPAYSEEILTKEQIEEELDYLGVYRFLKKAFGVEKLVLRGLDEYEVDHNSRWFIFNMLGLKEDFCETLDKNDEITEVGQRIIDFLVDSSIILKTDSEKFGEEGYLVVNKLNKLASEEDVYEEKLEF